MTIIPLYKELCDIYPRISHVIGIHEMFAE